MGDFKGYEHKFLIFRGAEHVVNELPGATLDKRKGSEATERPVAKGIISKSCSSLITRRVLSKKINEALSFVVGCCKTNESALKNNYPLPSFQDYPVLLRGSGAFS